MISIDLKLAILILLLLTISTGSLAHLLATGRRRSPIKMVAAAAAENLPHVLESAPFGILLLDANHEIEFANQYALRLMSPEWQGEFFQDVAAARDIEGHYRVVNLPSDRAVSWWICPLGDWTAAVIQDLSQQRRSERGSQLFLSTLSHELRTPLTAILAHVEVMRSPELPDAVYQNSLKLIHRETNRISRLVQNLLELSRLEAAGELLRRPVNLLLLVEEAIADVILDAEARDIPLSLQSDSGLTEVLADRDALKQVLLNLLDNGIKYSRQGDRIDVTLAKHEGGVEIAIKDTGPGIPAEQLPHLGEKLYRGRTDVEGSGLGLAIVDEILRRHQSRLEVESEHGGESTGTTAWFVLPAV